MRLPMVAPSADDMSKLLEDIFRIFRLLNSNINYEKIPSVKILLVDINYHYDS
jgi:hypothetical protein